MVLLFFPNLSPLILPPCSYLGVTIKLRWSMATLHLPPYKKGVLGVKILEIQVEYRPLSLAGAEDFIWWKAHNLNGHLLRLFLLGGQEDGSTPVPPTPWQLCSKHRQRIIHTFVVFYLKPSADQKAEQSSQSQNGFLKDSRIAIDFLEQLFNLECLVFKTPELGESH